MSTAAFNLADFRFDAQRDLLLAAIRAGDDVPAANYAAVIAAVAADAGITTTQADVLQAGRDAVATMNKAREKVGDGVRLIAGTEVEIQPVRWLWPGYLARGKLHICAGAPGTGKTTIGLSLAAAMTRKGARLPDGATVKAAGNVLIWSGEDDIADTLAPRLRAMGADMSRVRFVGDLVQKGKPRPFNPATDMPRLAASAAELRPVFLHVDPVVLTVAGDSHKNAEVRRGLQPLCDLSAALDCAAFGVTHYTKGTQGRDPIERVSGSLAFGAAARIILATAVSREDKQRIFVRAKSNIGPDGGGFYYEIEPYTVDGVNTSRICWREPVQGTAHELLATAEQSQDDARTLAGDAADFLRAALADGPAHSADVMTEGEAQGFSRRTLQRAADDLRVRRVRTGFGPGSSVRWSLPIDAKSAEQETMASMAPMASHIDANTHIDAIDDIKNCSAKVASMGKGVKL